MASASPDVAPDGQVDLRGIAIDGHAASLAEPRQKHLHLLRRGVLGLIQDDEGIPERAAAHERQRCDFDGSVGQAARNELVRRDVIERIIERAEIGIDLLLHVAGKEAQALARLNGRTRQDDAIDFAGSQRRSGGGDRQIGLAGSRRAGADDQIVLAAMRPCKHAASGCAA